MLGVVLEGSVAVLTWEYEKVEEGQSRGTIDGSQSCCNV
jgi:hypothetical protein